MYKSRLFSGYLKSLKRRHLPNEIIYFVTNKCNSSCQGCFYRDELNKPINELGLSEVERISKSMDDFFILLVSGGEPFIRDDLSDICHIFYRNNHVRSIYIPTNGLLRDDILKKTRHILNKCPGAHITVGVSLDGMEKTHDNLRGMQGGFKKTLKTLDDIILLRHGFNNFSVGVNSVASKSNYKEIPRLYAFIKKTYDVDYHSCGPLRNINGGASKESPTRKQWDSLNTKLQEYYRHYLSKNNIRFLRFRLEAKQRLHKLIGKTLDGYELEYRCLAGNMVGVIEPGGNVRMCESMKPIGNLRGFNYDFSSLWFSEEAESARKKIKHCSCISPCFLIPSLIYRPNQIFILFRTP